MGLTKFQMLKALLWPWIKNQAGITTPYGFFLSISTRCNKRCGYCTTIDGGGHTTTFATAKKAIDIMHSKGCRYVGLMGGEPLLYPELVLEIIRYAKWRGMITYLPTNLALLTPSLLDGLIGAGVTVIDIAVDTIIPKEGLPKNLVKIEENLELLLGRRKEVIIKLNVVMTKANMSDVKNLVVFANDRKVPISVHLVENYSTTVPQALLFSRRNLMEVVEISKWLEKRQMEGYWITNSRWCWREMVEVVRRGTRSFSWRCPAQDGKTMFIDEHGKFYPCLSLKGKGEYGNIFTGFVSKEIKEKECISCLSCINAICSELDSSPFAVAKFLWKFLSF